MEGRTVYLPAKMWEKFTKSIPGDIKVPGKAMYWLVNLFNQGKIDKTGLEKFIVSQRKKADKIHTKTLLANHKYKLVLDK
jgi:hypothetical protein